MPLHPFDRSLATLEALIGRLFPATLLARLVSLAGRAARLRTRSLKIATRNANGIRARQPWRGDVGTGDHEPVVATFRDPAGA